jgi:hypothetical protein
MRLKAGCSTGRSLSFLTTQRVIQMAPIALSGGVGGRDLAIDNARLRDGDWAMARNDGAGLRALGRVNCITRAAEARKALCSIFWVFDGDTLPRYGSSPDFPRDRPGKAQTSLRRMVAWLASNYGIGSHRPEARC